MDAGAYRNRVIIQKSETVSDKIGNRRSVWKDFKICFAYVNGLSGREYWQAAAIQSENTTEFVLRWHPFFEKLNTKEYRIAFNGQIYDITGIDNIQHRNCTVKIRAVMRYGED